MHRPTTLLATALLLAVPGPGRSQVAAPAPIDETEPTAPASEGEAAPTAPRSVPAGLRGAPASPGGRVPRGAPLDEPPSPGAPGAPDSIPPPPAPAPPPPPEPPAARRIEPVTAGWDAIMAAWTDRRSALREQDLGRADRDAEALLAARRQLAIENLFAFAVVEARDSARALASHALSDAVAHAELAVRLAPDLADAHLALARARLSAGRAPGEIAEALGDGLAAAWREPHTRRAFLGDLAAAALAAIFTAGAATVLLLLVRTLRLFLHDFHHLPLLRDAAPVQASLLGISLLAAPLAFGLGPWTFLAAALAAAWLYLGTAERVAGAVSLALVAALPWAGLEAVRLTAWTGTPAEVIQELEHGAVDDARAARLAAGAATSPQLAAALGRHFKRRGDLAAALRWYRAAAAGDDRAPELDVDVGNVLFLEGDLDGAKAAYLAAGDRAGGDLRVAAAAHYDLSKLYLRSGDIAKSSAARDRGEEEDGPFLHRHGADDDFSANRYLVDVPVPPAKIEALAAADPMALVVERSLRRRLAGPVPARDWPWLAGGLLAALWLVVPFARRIGPSQACDRCGRPACHRCDPGGGPLCGQCVNVFVKKGLVDARDRLRKEAQVARRRRVHRLVARILAVLGGGAGHVFDGRPGRGLAFLTAGLFAGFLVWFWRGVTPPPLPSPGVVWGKVAVAGPLWLAVHLAAVRGVFRRTRG